MSLKYVRNTQANVSRFGPRHVFALCAQVSSTSSFAPISRLRYGKLRFFLCSSSSVVVDSKKSVWCCCYADGVSFCCSCCFFSCFRWFSGFVLSQVQCLCVA